MIVRTCTQCRSTQKEALFWAVGAWNRADGVRVAYKHKLCLLCVTTKVVPIQNHSDNAGMTCPNCGIDTSEDYDAVYLTWIPKGVGKLHAEAPFCNACAANFRLWWQQGGELLEDRDIDSRAADVGRTMTADQVLAGLGLTLRDR